MYNILLTICRKSLNFNVLWKKQKMFSHLSNCILIYNLDSKVVYNQWIDFIIINFQIILFHKEQFNLLIFNSY